MNKATINLYKEKGARISKGMTGLFFEDINYGADGGLYAEMIENRHFEFYKSFAGGPKGDFYAEHDGLYGWSAEGNAELKVVSGSPVARENPHYLRASINEKGAGFKNKAYDGITAKKGIVLNVSFWCRNNCQAKSVTVRLKNSAGKKCGSVEVPLNLNDAESLTPWHKYEAELTVTQNIRKGEFAVLVNGKGTIEFDFFSCIPSDAVCGIFRKDLFDLLKEIKPGFLRFPGGCIVEGSTLENRYDYKKTIRPLEQRPNNWSRWAVHNAWVKYEGYEGPNSYPVYNQTYGIGFYEYFLLCEALKCKPLPVLSVGIACQFQSFETVPVESEEFKQYVQDALDLIEFANGPVDSKWGSVRASLGHKKPFNLELLGVGNEQWEDKNNRFFDRAQAFEKAVHAVYPEIRIIGTAGPHVEWPQFKEAWNFIRKNCRKNPDFVYAADEHYYMPPAWFLNHVDFYDKYPRDVKVFAGEYAAHEDGGGSFNRPGLNTLEAAVSEAAFMTGIERNADVVVLASYAPLFARMGYTQWSPDMIWFDDETSYGSPSYYVQKLYGNYTGTVCLDTKGEQKALYREGIYWNASMDEESGKIFVKIANTNDEAFEITLNNLTGNAYKKVKRVFMGGSGKKTVNSFEKPEAVCLTEKTEKGETITLEPNSFSVIVLSR